MGETNYALGFALFPGIGPVTFTRLHNYFGGAKNAWEKLNPENRSQAGVGEKVFAEFDLFRKSFEIQKYLEKLRKTKVVFIPITDKKYPESLKGLARAPIGLFCRGNVELLKGDRAIGVVGTRKITSYGRAVTEKLVSELVNYGFTIVSGLALGVDATAHKSTLNSKGATIAVLGCGVDCCTPEENYDLYLKILDSKGLIISEYPLGMPSTKGSFPARNRIIAGLSLGVLVTEAAEDSGSLITAGEAQKLGRPIFAVPGPINSAMSFGTLKLLKQGARLVSKAEDIPEHLEIKSQNARIKITIQNLKLNKEEKKILEILEAEPLSLDLLSRETKIPIHKLLGIISGLEMRRIVKNNNGEIVLTYKD